MVETTDLDPDGYSRPAAMWLTAGRCLGLVRLALVAVEAGVCGEVLVVLRGLHEARELLAVLGDQNEDELLRVWLDDEGKHQYVSLAKSLRAHERFEEMLAEAMERKGYGELSRSTEVSAEMYDKLSRAGHNRRSAALDARPMLPPGTWEAQWAPPRDSVDATNTLAPLDVASIRRAAGTG